MMVALLALVTLAALAMSAFCAGAETGFMSLRRGRLVHMVRLGSRRAKILSGAFQNLGRTTTALLVGNNFANVTYSSASAALSAAVFGDSHLAQSVWGVAAAMAVLYFGEFAPKLLCSARPLRRMLALAKVWKCFAAVFVPVGAVVQGIIGRFIGKRDATGKLTPDAVLRILADRKDGVRLSNLESVLIGRILSLRSQGRPVTPESLLDALDDCVR